VAKTNGLPNVVFVGDARRRIKHVLCVFRIIDKYDDGTPRTVERIPDDMEIAVEDGMEFMTGYVQHQMIER
jgi:hypothetical protein